LLILSRQYLFVLLFNALCLSSACFLAQTEAAGFWPELPLIVLGWVGLVIIFWASLNLPAFLWFFRWFRGDPPSTLAYRTSPSRRVVVAVSTPG
jgi:hypothetical protein